jgi:uncharacterized membrane protein YGL010W
LIITEYFIYDGNRDINVEGVMATLHEWLDTYGKYHQNQTNQFIHEICVPLIVFSVLGLLWIVPIPHQIRQSIQIDGVGLVNMAVLIFILALIYYIKLSRIIALGMAVMTIAMLIVLGILSVLGFSILFVSIGIFIVSWVGQFVGHKIEGKKPAFLTDVQFLLMGPAWILARLYKKIGILL